MTDVRTLTAIRLGAGSPQAGRDIRAPAHQPPDETGSGIFGHQNGWELIQPKVPRREAAAPDVDIGSERGVEACLETERCRLFEMNIGDVCRTSVWTSYSPQEDVHRNGSRPAALSCVLKEKGSRVALSLVVPDTQVSRESGGFWRFRSRTAGRRHAMPIPDPGRSHQSRLDLRKLPSTRYQAASRSMTSSIRDASSAWTACGTFAGINTIV